MGYKPISVGVNPVVLIDPNPRRTSWKVVFVSSSIESGNTGRVHVQKDAPPVATLQAPNQGLPMLQGDQAGEKEAFVDDNNVHKGAIWGVGSIAAQIIWVEEIVRPAPGG